MFNISRAGRRPAASSLPVADWVGRPSVRRSVSPLQPYIDGPLLSLSAPTKACHKILEPLKICPQSSLINHFDFPFELTRYSFTDVKILHGYHGKK